MKTHAARVRIVFTSLTLFTSFVLIAGAQQQQPAFRAGIDLRQLDVTVLGKQRQPVRGLSSSDFRIEEDGVAQAIEAFSFVDVADVAVTETAWSSRVASDVVTNSLDSARAFTLVIDDGGIGDLWAEREMPKSVATFVDQLGSDDIGAVVFVQRSGASQNFTRDKAKLIQSANRYAGHPGGGGKCATPETMLYVAQNLGTMKNRRKAIVYFGGRLVFTTSAASECGPIWAEMVRAANENNVTVYTVDTMGLRPYSQVAADQYLSLAHHAGGRALVNSNGFDEGLNRIFAENTSYYLLAYQPTNAADDGRFRRVTVKVNRPNVEVVSTRSYWAPKAPTAKRPAPPQPSPEVGALSGVLPVSQIPLRATAAAFRTGGSSAAVVAVALGLQQPAFDQRTRETVDLLVRTFTPDGFDFGSERSNIDVTVPVAADGAVHSRYDVLTRIEVPKPGRYELRLSAYSTITDLRGSIYVDVDVPDFENDKLSLSGVVLSAIPGPPVSSPRGLTDVVPITPTTERSFVPASLVTAFLKLYQGGADRLATVSLKIRIVNAAGKAVFEKAESVAAERFSAERSADYQLRLPLSTLTAGEYLLTFEAGAGKAVAKRDVRFQVR